MVQSSCGKPEARQILVYGSWWGIKNRKSYKLSLVSKTCSSWSSDYMVISSSEIIQHQRERGFWKVSNFSFSLSLFIQHIFSKLASPFNSFFIFWISQCLRWGWALKSFSSKLVPHTCTFWANLFWACMKILSLSLSLSREPFLLMNNRLCYRFEWIDYRLKSILNDKRRGLTLLSPFFLYTIFQSPFIAYLERGTIYLFLILSMSKVRTRSKTFPLQTFSSSFYPIGINSRQAYVKKISFSFTSFPSPKTLLFFRVDGERIRWAV